MTQTTSGIEPVFMPVYKRRRKVNPNDKNAVVSFKDEWVIAGKNIMFFITSF
jgi:ribonucleoside-diphosphate reductase alpha chain